MKIKLVAVGNLKDSYWKDACNEYLKRLKRFAEVTVIEIPEETVAENATQIETAKNKEGTRILQAVKEKMYLLSLDGEQLTSEKFAKYIKEDYDLGRTVTFVIGGSYGTSNGVNKRADKKIAFGKITFPHRLMRVVFLEQLYRAFTINNNISYHK